MPRYRFSRHSEQRMNWRGVSADKCTEATLDGDWYDLGNRTMVVHRDYCSQDKSGKRRGKSSDLVTIFDHSHRTCITMYRDHGGPSRRRRFRGTK